jgi:hypothetical protein
MTTAKIATIMKNKVTVSIERDTLNRLKKYGSMDDTYDSVLNRF